MFTKNERKAEEKIVISGISGVYPNCENISELANKLFAKEDLVTGYSHNVVTFNYSITD